MLCSQCVGGSRGSRRWVGCCYPEPWGWPSRGFGGRGAGLREGSVGLAGGEQASSKSPACKPCLELVSVPVDNLGRISPIRWCRERGLRQAGAGCVAWGQVLPPGASVTPGKAGPAEAAVSGRRAAGCWAALQTEDLRLVSVRGASEGLEFCLLGSLNYNVCGVCCQRRIGDS